MVIVLWLTKVQKQRENLQLYCLSLIRVLLWIVLTKFHLFIFLTTNTRNMTQGTCIVCSVTRIHGICILSSRQKLSKMRLFVLKTLDDIIGSTSINWQRKHKQRNSYTLSAFSQGLQCWEKSSHTCQIPALMVKISNWILLMIFSVKTILWRLCGADFSHQIMSLGGRRSLFVFSPHSPESLFGSK